MAAKNKKPGYVYDIIAGPVRAAFCHLANPNEGGQYPSHKYELHGLIPKDATDVLTLLRDKGHEAAAQVWPGIAVTDVLFGVRNGDDKAHLDGFSGAMFINPKSKRPVPCYGPGREEIDADSINNGDYVYLCVTAGAYRRNLEPEVAQALRDAGKTVREHTDDDGKRSFYRPAVTYYLNAVQLVRRGDPLGAGGKGPDPSLFPVHDSESGANASGASPESMFG